MYTELKSYQIVIALLKEWGIRHCVLSAGSRNVPFVHSVEQDDYFKCYSVVDERSAAYFALGLAQQLNEPVVISCTSSTATCNYWPAVAEAFYQSVPLVVLTSDRNPAMVGQWEDQCIDQVGMYDRHVRKSVNLPLINGKDDEHFCWRLVNEALLELNHEGSGPVHINVPMKGYNNSFNVKSLPVVKRIERLEVAHNEQLWQQKIERLKQSKRILVTCGQKSHVSAKLRKAIDTFFHRYNATIAVEYMSNVECEGALNDTVCTETRYLTQQRFKDIMPDIVISYGGNITLGLKYMLLNNAGKFEHWSIQEDGRVVDMYKSLTTIFQCTPEYFFDYANRQAEGQANDMQYHTLHKQLHDSVKYPDFEWSNIYAIERVVEGIPSGSILHLAINNAIRIANFFPLQPNIKVYANVGTHGIDGCLSSLVGQSTAMDGLAFLVIGDLSFFYDMNALRIRHIRPNVRILMINNEGGEEFYYNKMWRDELSDLHTTARHHTKAEGWVKECGFTYLAAHSKEELDAALPALLDANADRPVFLEVFTEMSDDARKIYDFYDLSRPRDLQSEVIRRSKDFVKRTIGQERAQNIVNTILGKK